MNLDDWQARIERLHPQEIELGLGRIRAVAERLEVNVFACPVITVAGTNGKGSTVTLIERLARAAGRSTALYTSPHLHRFNERVRLDGEPVSDAMLCQAFERVESVRGDVALTYFEFTTLAALCVFQQAGVDLVVLEVGLGGRLDAVNLIDADIAVITSIGLDHQDWLGDNVEQIGREKAGILRAGRPLLFAAMDMPESIAQAAEQGAARLIRAGEVFGVHGSAIYWQQSGSHHLEVSDPLPLGRDNLAAAVQALALLDMLPADIAAVAASTILPGRCQHKRIDGCDWYFDVGHNREALQRFLSLLPAVTGRRRALCAMLADKPAEQVLADFQAHVDDWYLAGLGGSRGRSASALAGLLPDIVPRQIFANVAEAVAAVREQQSGEDQVLVFGSFYTVAEAAAALAVEL
ncbi:folylpolyglutamate synthase/dihydrofolate synthase family protein [Alcanivorax sp. 1008]|uniref:bifunctional folylpolyglutamate synthase/dihydrofolate synthase n=1 Tax=Alcanivorax sp. 1008 TaxID=2816853 RepID=UPI001DC559B2|nr:folylpolyglutamate synthase/dihydrofolate synthase family protein [Alcanivorax sp. 1008]MCC1496329.1 bifunctional folylpolyglutamate synthase/dihydrofolate synthase [Alcanivorax sp. 1008]